MLDITIDRMTKDDLEGIFEVEQTAFPIPWPISSFEEELKNILATYLVAKYENKVIGYIGMWFVMDECHITNVAVHSDYRKQKVAERLVQKMFELCKEHECTYATLEVRKNNFPAQNLYKKFGFREEALRKGYYQNPDGTREDALVMSIENFS